ncbi:MAG: DNA-directed RNA polymerase subunit L [Candidatus Diapherotrites archaeon]|nr:DNA-directed RNA polymerase subunit L [Candidatus Diapherotrites archaeon]
MDLEILSKSKTELEFKLLGERHTLPQLLKSELLKDPKVEFASYKLNHPLDNYSVFYIRSPDKDPKKALDDACKNIEKQLTEFKKNAKAAK